MNGGSYTASLAIARMRLAASRASAAPDDVPCTTTVSPALLPPGQRDQRLEVIDLPVGRIGPSVAAGAAAPAIVGVDGEARCELRGELGHRPEGPATQGAVDQDQWRALTGFGERDGCSVSGLDGVMDSPSSFVQVGG